MACERCVTRGKTWAGADPECAFESGEFSADNWNCATMNALRDIAEHGAVWNEDDYAAVIPCDWTSRGFLVLSWYKRRGSTETAFWLLDREVRPLTTALAETVIKENEAALNG